MDEPVRSISADLGGIVATCVTPYQKVADYFKNKNFKDKTFFLAEEPPRSWEASQHAFEGEGGLQHPTGLQQNSLANGDALYETPAAILQYRFNSRRVNPAVLAFSSGRRLMTKRFFALRKKHLSADAFTRSSADYAAYVAQGKGCLRIKTPDRSWTTS